MISETHATDGREIVCRKKVYYGSLLEDRSFPEKLEKCISITQRL